MEELEVRARERLTPAAAILADVRPAVALVEVIAPLLLSVEAERGTEWGECVGPAFWIPEEDFAAGRPERVRLVPDVA